METQFTHSLQTEQRSHHTIKSSGERFLFQNV